MKYVLFTDCTLNVINTWFGKNFEKIDNHLQKATPNLGQKVEIDYSGNSNIDLYIPPSPNPLILLHPLTFDMSIQTPLIST